MSEIVRAVERVLDILMCYSEERSLLTVPEISEMTGLTKSTVFRLLASLEYKDFVEKNEKTFQYKLGVPLLRLGNIVQSSFDLTESALPVMQELADKTNETVNVNIMKNGKRVCIEKIDGNQALRKVAEIGELLPLYKGASGKLLLAFSEQDEIIGVLKEAKKELTKEEINQVKIQLFDIRENGYATSLGERIEGTASISAPIRDYTGEVIAGLTISGPSIRFTKEILNCFIEEITHASKRISRSLGYQ